MADQSKKPEAKKPEGDNNGIWLLPLFILMVLILSAVLIVNHFHPAS